jgi:predicted transcriptional regulator
MTRGYEYKDGASAPRYHFGKETVTWEKYYQVYNEFRELTSLPALYNLVLEVHASRTKIKEIKREVGLTLDQVRDLVRGEEGKEHTYTWRNAGGRVKHEPGWLWWDITGARSATGSGSKILEGMKYFPDRIYTIDDEEKFGEFFRKFMERRKKEEERPEFKVKGQGWFSCPNGHNVRLERDGRKMVQEGASVEIACHVCGQKGIAKK